MIYAHFQIGSLCMDVVDSELKRYDTMQSDLENFKKSFDNLNAAAKDQSKSFDDLDTLMNEEKPKEVNEHENAVKSINFALKNILLWKKSLIFFSIKTIFDSKNVESSF